MDRRTVRALSWYSKEVVPVATVVGNGGGGGEQPSLLPQREAPCFCFAPGWLPRPFPERTGGDFLKEGVVGKKEGSKAFPEMEIKSTSSNLEDPALQKFEPSFLLHVSHLTSSPREFPRVLVTEGDPRPL